MYEVKHKNEIYNFLGGGESKGQGQGQGKGNF